MNLLVITNERISQLIAKGCLTQDYYNPGGIYKKVGVMLLHDEYPSGRHQKEFQKTCGNADVSYCSYPIKTAAVFCLTLFWRPLFVAALIRATIDRVFIEKCNPDIIRAEGCEMCGFVASIIKKIYGIPYFRKLGNNPDTDVRERAQGLSRVLYFFSKGIEKECVLNADLNVCVYSPIVKYVERLGGKYKVLHNVTGNPQAKDDYEIPIRQIRIVSINRIMPGKDPSSLYTAMDILSQRGHDIKFDLYSGGTPNSEILAKLHTYDIAVFRSDYPGLSKGVIECAKAGLPIIHNYNNCAELYELCFPVNATGVDYAYVIETFIKSKNIRTTYGERNRESAKKYINGDEWIKMQIEIIKQGENHEINS